MDLTIPAQRDSFLQNAKSITHVGNSVNNGTTGASMFSGCDALVSVGDCVFTHATTVLNLFAYSYALVDVGTIDINTANTSSSFTLEGMFTSCARLRVIPRIRVRNLDAPDIIYGLNTRAMFLGCPLIKEMWGIPAKSITNGSLMYNGTGVSGDIVLDFSPLRVPVDSMFQGTPITSLTMIFGGTGSSTFSNVTNSCRNIRSVKILGNARTTLTSGTYWNTLSTTDTAGIREFIMENLNNSIDMYLHYMSPNAIDAFFSALAPQSSGKTISSLYDYVESKRPDEVVQHVVKNKFVSTIQGSNVVTDTASSLTVAAAPLPGFFVSGTTIGVTATITSSNSVISFVSDHGILALGTIVYFVTTVGSVNSYTPYYVVSIPSTTTIEISTTPGGVPIIPTVSGTASMQYSNRVVSVGIATKQYVLENKCNVTSSSRAVVYTKFNIFMALAKGFSVT